MTQPRARVNVSCSRADHKGTSKGHEKRAAKDSRGSARPGPAQGGKWTGQPVTRSQGPTLRRDRIPRSGLSKIPEASILVSILSVSESELGSADGIDS